MPYTIRKVRNKNCYKTINTYTKRVFSKCTTREKAEKQLRFLRAYQYNKNFIPIQQTRKNKTRKNKK